MRIAVVSESFLPTFNGVTNSVTKLLDYLRDHGHEAIVIVPAAGAPRRYAGFPIFEVAALAYRQFPVGLPSPQVQKLLADFKPDVIHAASPFLLGAQAIAAGGRLAIPTIAVFQTDVAGYASRNRLGAATRFAWRIVRWIHDGADLTLAPSTASLSDLEDAGIERLALWGRGVDLATYHPRNRTSPTVQRLRQRLAQHGEVIIGYVGRVAPEKQVERMAALRGVSGIRLVVVGEGPSMPLVKRELKGMPVHFLGKLTGQELAAAYGSFDFFLHTGTEETFGQTLQEAHASGIPVVAPRAGGPIDLVSHGVNGFLFEPHNDDEMRAYVERIVADEPMRMRMGEAGRRSVLDRSWEAVFADLFEHYAVAIAAREATTLLAREPN